MDQGIFENKDVEYLTDGEIDLRLKKRTQSDEKKGFLPAYKYDITVHNKDEIIGSIDIRIGHNENSYYGGNVGYLVKEDYRGNNYALKALKIIGQVAIKNGMDKIIVTCNPDNLPSRRTCEKAGLKLKEIVNLPEYNEMYKKGERRKCIFEWILL